MAKQALPGDIRLKNKYFGVSQVSFPDGAVNGLKGVANFA